MAISISLHAEPVRRRVVLAAVAATLAFAALIFGAVQVSRSGLFHARAIVVVGAAHLSEPRVAARAAVSEATNVIWLDAAAAERRLEAHRWIADAHVSRSFPATIRIEVVERAPVAVVSERLGDLLVSADGTALGPPGRSLVLPRIRIAPTASAPSGSTRDAAAAILGAMPPELRAEVRSLDVDAAVELRLRGGIRVGFGSLGQPARKASVLERILSWADASGERIVWLSVVAPNAPAVRLAA